MKILMLGWELPPHNSGGLGTACLNLCRALSHKGVDIEFVVPYTAKHEGIDFMTIHDATPVDPLFRFGGGAYDSLNIHEKNIPVYCSLEKNSAISIRDIQEKYCDYVEEYLALHDDISCIHAHDWLTFEAGMLAKRLYGVPFVAHVHATEYDRAGMHTGNPLVTEIEREGLMMADKIFAVSDITRSLIHDKYGVPLDKIDVAYNALDEKFLRSPYHYDQNLHHYIEHKKHNGYTIVSTVGRFTIQKGLEHFLHAARLALEKNDELLFIMAGDGEEKNELIELSAQLGISDHVLFVGFVRGQKLRDIYSMSDIFVMSSISEPFGLTALEAAHYGNALILTKQSGVSEVLKSAITYDFWDDRKLADDIVSISASSTLRDTLRDSIRQEYRRISWDDVADECIRTYKKIRK